MNRLRQEALKFASLCALELELKKDEINPGEACVALTLEEYGPEPAPMVWGLQAGSAPAPVTHVAAEGVLANADYHQALHFRPLAVPATGLVGWPALLRPAGRDFYRRISARPFYLAGFYEPLAECGGQWRETFAILTAQAQPTLPAFRDRADLADRANLDQTLPLLLQPDELEVWLGGGRLEEFLKRVA